jgi:2-dehydro-3-deoxygalactonokinase
MTEDTCIVLGDWGTSRLRLFLVKDAAIQDHLEGPGIGALLENPIDALRRSLAPWLEDTAITRVVLCGMAGSRNGLVEIPYLPAPAELHDWLRDQAQFSAHGIDVAIAPGVSGKNAWGAPDVMRGEETQIFGAMQAEPALAKGRQLLVLPGTHSKWVQLEDGVIAGFTTFITGELFALLRNHSTLLRAGNSQASADGGFDAGLCRGHTCGTGLAAALFETRSAQILTGRSQGWGADFLSGLLIGAEVHAALEQCPNDQSVTIIGDPQLTALYRRSLRPYRGRTHELDGDRCAIAGLQLLAQFSRQRPAI